MGQLIVARDISTEWKEDFYRDLTKQDNPKFGVQLLSTLMETPGESAPNLGFFGFQKVPNFKNLS
jgi:hypothetical protein